MNYSLFIISLVVTCIPSSFTSLASLGITSQEKLNKELLDAVRQNNHAQVLIVLKAGADINTHDNWTHTKSYSGYTPLHYAVHYNFIKLAQLLLDFGAQINSIDTLQRTPLHYTARDHKADFAELLLSHKALVNCQDSNGDTPLHVAFEKLFSTKALLFNPLGTHSKHYNTLVLLLSHGANVNAQAHNGKTPLHYAVMTALSLPVELLLVHKADVTLQDNNGADALYCTSSIRIIKLLLDFGATDKHWQDPTHAASARFNNDLGFNFNPLLMVKESRETQTVTYLDLLSRICESNPVLKQEAFKYAIKEGYYELVKLFVRSGMQVTLENLLLAKSQHACHSNDFDHKTIGRFLFTYLQLFGIHSTCNTQARQPHSIHSLLARISPWRPPSNESLIGPISKQGILNNNFFTENIVRTIARYI